jgi:hypothetical protein
MSVAFCRNSVLHKSLFLACRCRESIERRSTLYFFWFGLCRVHDRLLEMIATYNSDGSSLNGQMRRCHLHKGTS